MYSLIAALAIALVSTFAGAGVASAHHVGDGCPQLIIDTFGSTAHDACGVSKCETRGNPWYVYATGSQGEKGLFQIHPSWGWRSSYDPETNVEAAYYISKGGYDWSQWSCRYWWLYV